MRIRMGGVLVDTEVCDSPEDYERAAEVLELVARMIRKLFVPKAREMEQRQRQGTN